MNADIAAGLVLFAAGAICGVGTLAAMRRFSDQQALRVAKSRVRAHLYELRLFGDDPVLALRAQKRLLLWNVRYVKLALLPAAVVLIPALLLMGRLEALFGHSPLRPGETATVTVQFAGAPQETALLAPPGFAVESPAVRIPELRQVCWRVRASGPSDGALRLQLPGRKLECPLRAGPGLRTVKPNCTPDDTAVASIAVDYARREISLFGFAAHWLLWFALSWLAVMLLLKRRFRVVF